VAVSKLIPAGSVPAVIANAVGAPVWMVGEPSAKPKPRTVSSRFVLG
jgi:hypothetical protein